MPDFPSRLDLFAIGRDYTLQRATRIDPQQVDIAGSDVNIFVGSVSQIAYSLVLQLAYAINSLLLDGATDEDLDRYALDRYGITRKGESAAVGHVTFYRSSAAAGGGTVPAGTQLNTLTGTSYITTSDAVFGASSLSATALVRAVQAGADSQVGKNAIRRFQNISLVFDQSLQVNNPEATAGGSPSETDEEFRDRIRGFWLSARRGTLSAIEFGAKEVSGVASAQAVEALTTGAQPARVVLLYISDASGVSSAALGASVRQELQEYRAAGISVITSTSQPQIVSVSLKLTFKAGSSTSLLTDAIRGAVFEYVNSLPVNGTLYRAEILAVLSRFITDGLVVDANTLIEPAGDIVPSAGKTLRTTIDKVSILLCHRAQSYFQLLLLLALLR